MDTSPPNTFVFKFVPIVFISSIEMNVIEYVNVRRRTVLWVNYEPEQINLHYYYRLRVLVRYIIEGDFLMRTALVGITGPPQ